MKLSRLLITGIVAIAALCSASLAYAQASRIYLAGYLGLNLSRGDEISESTSNLSGSYDRSHAATFAGALGLRLNNSWRVEGEVSYRRPDMDRIDFDGAGSFDLGGDLGSWLYMVNLYYDFNYVWNNFRPFVGAGIGLAWHDATIDDISGLAVDASNDSLDLAWQLGGGLKYRIDDGLAFTGNYRYIGTTDLDIMSYNADYSAHEIRLGVEYDIPVDFLQ